MIVIDKLLQAFALYYGKLLTATRVSNSLVTGLSSIIAPTTGCTGQKCFRYALAWNWSFRLSGNRFLGR